MSTNGTSSPSPSPTGTGTDRPTGNHRSSVLPRDFTISQNISSALIGGAVHGALERRVCASPRAAPAPAATAINNNETSARHLLLASADRHPPSRLAGCRTHPHGPNPHTHAARASPTNVRGGVAAATAGRSDGTSPRRVRRAAAHELIVRSCRRFLGHARRRRGRELSERAMPTNG